LSAIEQIDPGSAYSVSGLFDSERRSVNLGVDGLGFTDAELNKLGVTHDSGSGWAQSSRFGRIYIHSKSWILISSHYARWIYIEDFFNNELFDGWVWGLELGWVWLSGVYNDNLELWLVSDGEKGSADGTWICPIISEKGKIYYIFLFDNMQDGEILEVSEDCRVGDINLEVVSVENAKYYVLAFRDDFGKGSIPVLGQSNTPDASIQDFLSNSNFKRVGVLEFIPSSAESSAQGEESVHVKLLTSHDADLSQNFTVNFDSVEDNIGGAFHQSIIGKSWHTIMISEDIVELVDSSQLKQAMDAQNFSLQGHGYISFFENARSINQRVYESALYRVMSVNEEPYNLYKISALEYNPSKFAAIDKKGIVRKPSLPIPPQADMTVPEPPEGLILTDLTV
jgi:hypothetical protein